MALSCPGGEAQLNKYAQAALDAVRICQQGDAETPQDAWEQATTAIFGWGTPSQRKGCPKGAFLGLCEEGLVKGIEPGKYTRSKKNKRYAVDAVAVLGRRPELAQDLQCLWVEVLAGEPKTHNQQMNVVIALWNSGLIRME